VSGEPSGLCAREGAEVHELEHVGAARGQPIVVRPDDRTERVGHGSPSCRKA